MRSLALIVLALVVARQFVRQCRRPTWAGGRFVLWGMNLIIAKAYKGSRYDAVQGLVMKSLSAAYLTVEQHRDLFATAGYSDVEVFEDRPKWWIGAVGRRPDSST